MKIHLTKLQKAAIAAALSLCLGTAFAKVQNSRSVAEALAGNVSLDPAQQTLLKASELGHLNQRVIDHGKWVWQDLTGELRFFYGSSFDWNDVTVGAVGPYLGIATQEQIAQKNATTQRGNARGQSEVGAADSGESGGKK